MNRLHDICKRWLHFLKRLWNRRKNPATRDGIHGLMDEELGRPATHDVLMSFIDIYTRTARRVNDLGHEQELEKLISIMRHNLQNMGVGIWSSESGSDFDDKVMTISHEDFRPTSNRSLADKVAVSVVPLFRWNVASDDKPQQILQKEEVILWQYTDQPIPPDTPQVVTDSPFVAPAPSAPAAEAPVGYLVAINHDEIISILTVDANCLNVYGTHPVPSAGVSVHPISLLDDQLTQQHFSIRQVPDSLQLEATLLDGQWTINGKYNNQSPTPLSDGDTILIGDITFKYIENGS